MSQLVKVSPDHIFIYAVTLLQEIGEVKQVERLFKRPFKFKKKDGCIFAAVGDGLQWQMTKEEIYTYYLLYLYQPK